MKGNRVALWSFGILAAATVWLSLAPVDRYMHLVPRLLGWDKAQHGLLYFVLATLARGGSRNPRQGLVLIGGVECLGGALELAQRFAPGRTPEWGDFLANSVGVAAALALGLWNWGPQVATRPVSS